MNDEEHLSAIKAIVDAVDKRVPVIAGTVEMTPLTLSI